MQPLVKARLSNWLRPLSSLAWLVPLLVAAEAHAQQPGPFGPAPAGTQPAPGQPGAFGPAPGQPGQFGQQPAPGQPGQFGQPGGQQPHEFLSTHPGHETRIQRLTEEMPEALAHYEQANKAPVAQLPPIAAEGRPMARQE